MAVWAVALKALATIAALKKAGDTSRQKYRSKRQERQVDDDDDFARKRKRRQEQWESMLGGR